MKVIRQCLTVSGLAAVLSVSAVATTGTYQIDPNHSTAQFVVRHLGISNVQGDFTKASGTVVLDDQDISKSTVNASIDVSSIDTRVQARDNDLKSPNFFDVAKYPAMTFASTKIWSTGNGTTKMTGDLTIHGVTREVTFDVSGPTAPINAMGGTRRGVEATTKVSRKDFGIAADAGVVGDQISITIDAELLQRGGGR